MSENGAGPDVPVIMVTPTSLAVVLELEEGVDLSRVSDNELLLDALSFAIVHDMACAAYELGYALASRGVKHVKHLSRGGDRV